MSIRGFSDVIFTLVSYLPPCPTDLAARWSSNCRRAPVNMALELRRQAGFPRTARPILGSYCFSNVRRSNIHDISPQKKNSIRQQVYFTVPPPAPHRDARARRDTRTRHERIHAKHSEPTLAQSCRHLTAACALALTALALAVLALAGPVCTVYQIRAILPTPRLQT